MIWTCNQGTVIKDNFITLSNTPPYTQSLHPATFSHPPTKISEKWSRQIVYRYSPQYVGHRQRKLLLIRRCLCVFRKEDKVLDICGEAGKCCWEQGASINYVARGRTISKRQLLPLKFAQLLEIFAESRTVEKLLYQIFFFNLRRRCANVREAAWRWVIPLFPLKCVSPFPASTSFSLLLSFPPTLHTLHTLQAQAVSSNVAVILSQIRHHQVHHSCGKILLPLTRKSSHGYSLASLYVRNDISEDVVVIIQLLFFPSLRFSFSVSFMFQLFGCYYLSFFR